MAVVPRIADVRLQRIQFQPGDRVLVCVHHRIDLEQERKLRKSIEKWAGGAVEVLIYSNLDADIQIEQVRP